MGDIPQRIEASVVARGVPFTRASGFGALFQLIDAEAGDGAAERLLSATHFGLVAYRPMQPVPFHLMNGLFIDAAALLGDRTLGARVGLCFQPEAFAPFAEYALAGASLGDVVFRANRAQPLHSSAERLDLRIEGDQAIWRLRYPGCSERSVAQHAERTLMPMLGAIGRYAGQRMHEVTVHLAEADAAEARVLERQLGMRVRGRQADYELVFPATWLGNWTPLPGWPDAALTAEMAPYIDQPVPPDMVAAVIAALDLGDDGAVPGIDTAAHAIGLHRHALQRALAIEHARYRDLLRHVRIARAAKLLRTTNQPIAEIALRAGYSDQANFHRAFAAVTGITPRQCRAQTTG
jgi:AraC-like DNA-binding protein